MMTRAADVATMKPHLELLVLCTYHPLSPDEQQRVRDLSAQTTDWDTFASLAELNKVEPKVCLALQQCGALERVPEPTRARLLQTADAVRLANEQRVERARAVFTVLAERGVPVCVLKGVLFAHTVYGTPGYKRMNDVDFLVPRERIAGLPEVFEGLGYFALAERVGKRADVQLEVSHHLPPFVSRDLRCVLGAQWGLKSPLLGLQIDYPAMWSRALPLDFHGVPLQQLSPADNLFHLCIHLGFFKSGLRDVMDLYNLARSAGAALDYALFARLIRDAGAWDLAYHALSLAQALCPQPGFAQVLRELEPHVSRFMRETVERKTLSLELQLQLCTGYLSVIEKAIADFNASGAAAEKLEGFAKFWKLVLLPEPDEARRLCFTPQPTELEQLTIPVRAPIAILRAIAREIGPGLLALLLLKGVLDTALTALDPRAWTPKERGLAAFANRHGLSLDDLQRLKNSIY